MYHKFYTTELKTADAVQLEKLLKISRIYFEISTATGELIHFSIYIKDAGEYIRISNFLDTI